MPKLYERIFHTDRSIIVEQPGSIDSVEQLWYLIADHNKLDADAYDIRCYLAGWWMDWDYGEYGTLNNGALHLLSYPQEVSHMEEGWAACNWTKNQVKWFRPPKDKLFPLMTWTVEYCLDATWPAYTVPFVGYGAPYATAFPIHALPL